MVKRGPQDACSIQGHKPRIAALGRRTRTTCAACTNSVLKYLLPRLEILPRIVRSPVDSCFGTRPSQAPKSRTQPQPSRVGAGGAAGPSHYRTFGLTLASQRWARRASERLSSSEPQVLAAQLLDRAATHQLHVAFDFAAEVSQRPLDARLAGGGKREEI